VLKEYSPKQVSSITGVSEEVIVEIAREFSSHQPSIAITGRGVGMQTNGTYSQMAVDSLNALAGSIDNPGGLLLQRKPPFQKWPPLQKDEIAEKGLSQPRSDGAGILPSLLLKNFLSPFRRRSRRGNLTLLTRFFCTIPILSSASPNPKNSVWLRKRFLSSSVFHPLWMRQPSSLTSSFPTEPNLERWQDDHAEPGLGFPMFGLRSPTLDKPLYDTCNTGDVIIDIAKGIGGTVGKSFP